MLRPASPSRERRLGHNRHLPANDEHAASIGGVVALDKAAVAKTQLDLSGP